MPARSFIGEVEDAARHFYATVLRGEVSDANVRGYLRAASQIEDVWQQIDDRVAHAIARGTAPWDAYAQMRYALAFIRAARMYQVFVRELLAADAAFEPATRGYLPRVTYDQANALCHQILPNLERAIIALNDPTYVPDEALPLELGPRIEADDGACPTAHLQGIISAAREAREWAAGLIAQYKTAVTKDASPPPRITEHLARLAAALAHADSQLRFSTDLIGQVDGGTAELELHEQAENSLWAALRGYFLVNQVVALPAPLARAPEIILHPAHGGEVAYFARRVTPTDLWRIAAPAARYELETTEFGRRKMYEVWRRMGGILSARAQRYLKEVAAAVARGDAVFIAAMASGPFEPIYRARHPVEIIGQLIAAGDEFHWDYLADHLELSPRFARTPAWQGRQG